MTRYVLILLFAASAALAQDAAPAAAPETAAAAAPEPQLEQRLQELTEEIKAPTEESPSAEEAKKAEKEKISAADAKLNDILGGK